MYNKTAMGIRKKESLLLEKLAGTSRGCGIRAAWNNKTKSQRKRGAGRESSGIHLQNETFGLGDGSVGKALAMQGKNLTSNSQNSAKASVSLSIGDLGVSVEGMEVGRSPEAPGPVNLTHTVRNSNEIQSHKVAGKESDSQGHPLTSTCVHYRCQETL